MKFAVLGLGPSIKEYDKSSDYDFTIGVNDIERHNIIVDYLLVINKLDSFKGDRGNIVLNSKPNIDFITHNTIDDFDILKPTKISTQRFTTKMKIDDNFHRLPHASTSTFVATILAYKMGATHIKIYGMDLSNHTGIYKGNTPYSIEEEAWKWLLPELERVGVIVEYTDNSFLNRI